MGCQSLELLNYWTLVTKFNRMLKLTSRQQRCVLARMRCGTYSLEIEKGRYRGIPAVRRFCKLCRDQDTVEEHFLIHRPSYSEERDNFLMDHYKLFKFN